MGKLLRAARRMVCTQSVRHADRAAWRVIRLQRGWNPEKPCMTTGCRTWWPVAAGKIGFCSLARCPCIGPRVSMMTTMSTRDHHHASAQFVTELPALEGFDLIDSLDKLTRSTIERNDSLARAARRQSHAAARTLVAVPVGALRPGHAFRRPQRRLVQSIHVGKKQTARQWREGVNSGGRRSKRRRIVCRKNRDDPRRRHAFL